MGGVGVNTGSGAEAPTCQAMGGCKHRIWGRSSASKLTCQAVGGVGVNTGSGAEAL